MPFPSTISSFTNPLPTDKLNSPSHSSIETAQNNELIQIENVLGTSTTSVIGTIIGDLRNPASAGGGHVQTANKGGTGQTSFAKGDLLVASSASVLSKLTVGVDGKVLAADSSTSAGVKWDVNGSLKVAIGTSVVTVTGNTETNLFGASIVGGVISSVNGIKFRAILPEISIGGTDTHTYRLRYDNNLVATCVVKETGGTDKTSITGVIEGYVLAKNAVTSQVGYIGAQLGTGSIVANGLTTNNLGWGTSSVNSASTLSVVVTVQHQNTSGHFTRMAMYTVEKIQ